MTLLSRILGFTRDLVFAQKFGANLATDAFYVAFRIPNFMRRLFAEGSFSLAFVPVLAEIRQSGDTQALRRFIDHVCGTLAGILLVVVGIGMLAAPVFVAAFAPGFMGNPQKFALTGEMLRVTFPYILLISLAGFAGGILNSFSRFALPALSPVLLNLALIAAALWLAPLFDEPVKALAWGVFIGGLLQLGLQIPGLMALGLLPRPRWGWRDRGVRKVLKLMVPTLFGSSVAQVNLLFDTLVASFLVTGSVTWLYYTDRLLEFPLGVFGVALGTVILPHLSARHAAADPQGFTQSVDWGLRLGLFIALPATLALVMLAEPMFWTLFGYGRFSALDARMSALSLSLLALGLPAFIAVKVLAPAFYARQDTRTPVKAGIASMLSNMGFSAIVVGAWWWSGKPGAHAGLALSSALAGYLNAGLLLRWLRRDGVYHGERGWSRYGLSLALATAAAAVVLWLVLRVGPDWPALAASQRLLCLTGLCVLAGLAYLGTAALLGLRPRHLLERQTQA
ncbi:MAG: murein biosynthesis integral membrane protein MurJ [Xanthomonadales bacterium]|nr:putative lipid II flippase MurJ [Xanthomonadales bacterium]MCC6594474.1 murein biosynthesis integral membrane protein MurJ [Xanthomonadales bacterium]MCE7931902.1 murein biosynthesis integral membrane protein MurJ [Xanthomonadales bacterium PRO6]